MKNNYVYLNYYQVCMFLIRINEIKEYNPNFNHAIIDNFVEYVKRRTVDIYLTPSIILKFNKNADKYKISNKLYNYLVKKTNVNVFDENELNNYLREIFEVEQELLSDREDLKDNVRKALKNYVDRG